jgi:hypothetical protein
MLGRHTGILLVFAALLVARVFGIISVYFFEEDEASLAIGAAALVADTPGDLYRYTVQVGYYRLVEVLDYLFGGRISLIPAIIKGLSAIAGALVPVLGFFAFRNELSDRERWLVVFILAVNPILWRSSQYGNTAMVSTALATLGLVVLSNRASSSGKAAALTCFGLAVLVRADAVLLAPAVLALLYRNSSSIAAALKWSAGFLAAVAAVYGMVLIADPRADSAAGSIARHMASPGPSMFWEFFLWAVGPIPLVFSLWGMRSTLDSRTRLLALVLLWGIPTLGFYFRATTTPRYFLNVMMPLAIAGAIGMAELTYRMQTWLRASTAWTLTFGLASLHLVLALGHVPPDKPHEIFYGGTFYTDDGPMVTGALLVRTYLTPGSFVRSLPRPRFGAQSNPFWEGPSFNKAIDVLADPEAPQRTVIVILSSGLWHAFHYHTHVAGARYISVPPKGTWLWKGETWCELGNARVMTVGARGGDYAAMQRFDVKAGDEIWALGLKEFPDPLAFAKMPSGLTFKRIPSFDDHFHTFTVIER